MAFRARGKIEHKHTYPPRSARRVVDVFCKWVGFGHLWRCLSRSWQRYVPPRPGGSLNWVRASRGPRFWPKPRRPTFLPRPDRRPESLIPDKHRPRVPDAKVCVLRRGEGRFGDAPDSANPPRSESAHARSAPGWSSPRLDPHPRWAVPGPTARLPEGGGASGGHAPASTSAGVSGRAAFPARSPASCVPWSRPPPLPCWIVRQPPPPLPPPPEKWRSREFSATAGVRGQRPSGPSRELPCWHAVSERPPSAPSLGLPAPEERRDAAPVTAGPRPCHPEWDRVLAHLPRRQPWTLHPTGDTMSSGQQPPRRVTNVGSLLLTPQENESLFSFLGKKCVVSGRDPRRHPQRPVAGSGWGDWRVGGRRGRARPGSCCGPGLQTPRALVLPSPCSPGAGRPGREPPPRAAGEQGSVTSAGQPRSSSRGPRPCCRFKLYSRPQGNFLRAPAA